MSHARPTPIHERPVIHCLLYGTSCWNIFINLHPVCFLQDSEGVLIVHRHFLSIIYFVREGKGKDVSSDGAQSLQKPERKVSASEAF